MEESFDRGIKKGGRDTWREQYSTMLISSLDLVITSLFNFSGGLCMFYYSPLYGILTYI